MYITNENTTKDSSNLRKKYFLSVKQKKVIIFISYFLSNVAVFSTRHHRYVRSWIQLNLFI